MLQRTLAAAVLAAAMLGVPIAAAAEGWGGAPAAQAPAAPPAEPRCPPFAELARWLKDKYGEEPAGAGVAGDGSRVVQVFVNPETKSFTIVRTKPDGQSCIVDAGKGWETVIVGGLAI